MTLIDFGYLSQDRIFFDPQLIYAINPDPYVFFRNINY